MYSDSTTYEKPTIELEKDKPGGNTQISFKNSTNNSYIHHGYLDALLFYVGDGNTIDVTMKYSGEVGIGTSSPGSKLHVNGGDAAITTQGKGLILKATDGANCFRLTLNNSGTLATASVTCP